VIVGAIAVVDAVHVGELGPATARRVDEPEDVGADREFAVRIVDNIENYCFAP
jgi:hypothetical protein